jgi:hypothetical protein
MKLLWIASSPQSIVFLLFAVALLSGCADRAGPIPNSITDEEYSVYSAWLKHHFKEQPTRLLLEGRTFIFDPLRPYGCGKTLAQAHVSSRLLRALHDLGEAEYPMQTDKFRLPPYRIPWKYEEWYRLSAYPSDGFRLIQFSRVAFNPDKSQGLFAASDSCGGLCGGGGALIAIREKSEWVFRSDLGCVWVY